MIQPTRWRKKSIVIDAMQWTGDNADVLVSWSGGDGAVIEPSGKFLLIHTLEGVMTANQGDWIIKGIKDEFYPCRMDIFMATYEPEDTDSLC